MSHLSHHRSKSLFLFLLLLCLTLSACAAKNRHSEDPQACVGGDQAFSVLILGDSQMDGAGWDGGYENCILEAYPQAQVVNLAQNGSLLSNGDIHAQWEYFLSNTSFTPDFVLFDGGTNDLPYLQKEEFKETGLPMVSNALSSLIELIHEAYPQARILYTLMPPFVEWKDSEHGPPAYEIQEHFWKQLNIVASGYDYVTVLDLFSLNPFRFPCAECYRENMADSIHLNETGYRNTFEYINNALVPHLASQPE